MKESWSDEEITAFLDGEMAPEAAARIREAARRDRDLARRIEALSIDTGALATAFDPLLAIARSRDLERCLAGVRSAREGAAGPAMRWRMRWAWPASLAAALAAGGVLAWILMQSRQPDWRTPDWRTPDWRTEVAHYQALYVPETLMAITPDAARLQKEFARAGAALGLDLKPESFTGIADLELRRAQVLGFDGAPLVQIAFTEPDGTPVAFCIIRREGEETPPEKDVLIGLAAASWSSPSHGFLVIGGDDTGRMLALARKLRQRLQGS